MSKAPLLPVNVSIYDGAAGDDGNLLFQSETPPVASWVTGC